MHAISLLAIICMHMCMKIASSRVAVSGIMMYIIFSLITTTMAAGDEQPATNMNEYHLPGLTKWNGVPKHDFRTVWWIALCAALGNIAQDGWSWLQTARD